MRNSHLHKIVHLKSSEAVADEKRLHLVDEVEGSDGERLGGELADLC